MKKHLVLLTLVSAILPSSANAADLTDVTEIVKRANIATYYAGKDGRASVRLTIVDPQGRTRKRVFTVLRRNRKKGGDQDYLVVFTRPADVRKTVFLVAKHPGKDDDRWLYLPALDLVKRIAAGDKRTSFVGSHFFYEDISGRDPRADRHKLVKTTSKQYVLVSTPRDPSSVEFAGYTVWIDKKTFLPLKMLLFDKSKRRYRRIEALAVETVEGHPTVTKLKVFDLRAGGHTIAEMRGIDYDLGIPASIFGERSLRSPPHKWLKKGH